MFAITFVSILELVSELKTGAVKLCNSYLVIEEDTGVQLLDQCRTEEGFDCPTSRGSASRSSLNRRLQVPEIEKRKKLLLENRKKSINEEVIDQVVRAGSNGSGGGS